VHLIPRFNIYSSIKQQRCNLLMASHGSEVQRRNELQ
jgi:hypothetical protein